MAEIDNSYIEAFMKNHKEIFDMAKWAMIEDTVNNKDNWTGNEEIREFTRKAIDIFKKYNCDPDMIIELFTIIAEYGKNNEKDDISEAEMTNFVSVLDKLRKKGKEDAAEGK